MKIKRLTIYLMPVFGSLILLVYFLFATAKQAEANQKKIDWTSYEKRFEFKNVQKFRVPTQISSQLNPLNKFDCSALYFQDQSEAENGSKHFLYSFQPNPSPNTRFITVLSSNGLITGMLYSKDGTYLDEYELASRGKNEKGIWESYGEFLNDSTYKYTRVVLERNTISNQLNLVDSVTRVYSILAQHSN